MITIVPIAAVGFALYCLWTGQIRYMRLSIQRVERPVLYWVLMLIIAVLSALSISALFNPHIRAVHTS